MSSSYGFDPAMEATSSVDMVAIANGESQLRRTWTAADPRAVVLIVHGIAEHSGRYEHVARQLVNAGFTVVAYDQRGHGETTGRPGHVDSFAEFHDDLQLHLADIRETGLPAVVLGHSMGGLVTASYGLTDRPQADLVVLSAPALALATPRWTWRLAKFFGRVIPKVRMKLPLKTRDLSADPRVGEIYLTDPSNTLWLTFGLIAAMAQTVMETEPAIERWTHTTLVIHGQADKIVPPNASEAIGELGSVELRSYPDLRHEIFNEFSGPEIVDDLVSWIDAALAS